MLCVGGGMDIRRTWFLLVIGIASSCLAADAQSELEERLARELVSVMKLEDQAVQKVEGRILAQCRREKCDADMRQCLMKIDRRDFVGSVGRALRRELTTDEVTQAIAYFKTEAGLKHLDILRAEQGLGGSDNVFNQAPAIRAGILAFLDTRAGYLLITRSVLSDGVNGWVTGQFFEAFYRC
jgi:hypothetical protein